MYSMVLMAALTTGSNAPDCGLLHGRFGCHGNSSCNGCSGSCYGCNGCYGGASSYNYRGCYGGCYGGAYGGCYGGAYYSPMSCHGCYGCGGYGWGGSTYAPLPVMPPAGGTEVKPEKDTKDKESAVPAKAHLIVELPADAKLYIDDQLMKSSNATKRTFSTPALQGGQSYYYDVRVEAVRDGKTYEGSKRIIVRAGEQIHASFNDAETGSTLAVQLEARR
jgi:uncharacterized protein (TIGR03000 family)